MAINHVIYSVENLVADRFINRYGETHHYLCQNVVLVRFACLAVFFIAFVENIISVCCIYSFIFC